MSVQAICKNRWTVAFLMVRFMRSTCPFVQGCRGLVKRWSTSFGRKQFERVGRGTALAGEHVLDLVRGPGIAGRLGEVGAVVGEHGVNPVGHGRDQGAQEIARDARVTLSCSSTKANLDVRSIATSR